MFDLRRVTGPAELPLKTDIARQHLRQDQTADDTMIEIYLGAAVQSVEDSTGRVLMPQTWEWRTRCMLRGCIRIPLAPLLEVVSVTAAGTLIDPTDYEVSAPGGATCGRGEIYWAGTGGTSLVTAGEPHPQTVIRFKAGYANADDVPFPLKAAILLALGSLYENREAEAEKSGTTARMLAENPAYQRLLRPYQLIG